MKDLETGASVENELIRCEAINPVLEIKEGWNVDARDTFGGVGVCLMVTSETNALEYPSGRSRGGSIVEPRVVWRCILIRRGEVGKVP